MNKYKKLAIHESGGQTIIRCYDQDISNWDKSYATVIINPIISIEKEGFVHIKGTEIQYYVFHNLNEILSEKESKVYHLDDMETKELRLLQNLYFKKSYKVCKDYGVRYNESFNRDYDVRVSSFKIIEEKS